MKKLLIWLGIILLLSSCAAEPIQSDNHTQQNASIIQPEDVREEICFDFFRSKMISRGGGVRTNYLDEPHEANFATGEEVLSESQGLLMLYAVAIHDEALLKSALSYVQSTLDTGRIISYRYEDDEHIYHVNALVDDLRIIRALLLAGDTFDGRYSETAIGFADRLYKTNVKDGLAYDMYDEQYGVTNDFITLCYIDFDTMRRLSADDARWDKVYTAMRDIVKQGYIGDAFPMFAASYSYRERRYLEGDINMVEATLTALNLARIGECPEKTLDWLRDKLREGVVYGSYDREGKASSRIESTAIYAICALIAKEVHDEDMYSMSINKMNGLQVTDEMSEVYGAFADPASLKLYAFDNLMALLAYRQ
jgi:hypothetical protein